RQRANAGGCDPHHGTSPARPHAHHGADRADRRLPAHPDRPVSRALREGTPIRGRLKFLTLLVLSGFAVTVMLIERAHRETTTASMIATLDAYERAQAGLERDAIK